MLGSTHSAEHDFGISMIDETILQIFESANWN